ncbi:hypothetical protein [Burkholderia vietnamiensis]|uniref:hypothetical protein n=1 Tax=Burkholderia vietnamiensis TaxID=60552 RepID=UPI0012D858A3|nr:hypothetical protein [Burkholderia vietnamiensis]
MGKKVVVTVVMDEDAEVTVKPLAARLAVSPPSTPEGNNQHLLSISHTVTSFPVTGNDGDADVDPNH